MDSSLVQAPDLVAAGEWFEASFGKDTLPFSFVLNGQPSAGLLPNWHKQQTQREIDARRTEQVLQFQDPETGLAVRCVIVRYVDFPTVEWTVYFKNTGSADSPILSDIRALDLRLSRAENGEFVLHHATGSLCRPNDFEPHESSLAPASALTLKVEGGYPTEAALPFFNIGRPGGGVIAALGWPGSWEARFERDWQTGLHIEAGQRITHFRLHPDEEVRSPLSVVQLYQGDWLQGQNIWRRWMVVHNLPRTHGELPPPIIASAAPEIEQLHYNEENQRRYQALVRRRDLPVGYWWIDAGWYENAGGWVGTGTWDEDKSQFPSGIRSVVDHGHTLGLKQILWFEPERVTCGSRWDTELGPWLIRLGGVNSLLNLGDPEARQFLTDFISDRITANALDVYRQDFNFNPWDYWRANDAEDRQGITEIRYVTGFLAFWDELRRRHPDLLIDTCASGGRRVDLETLRRSVPLLQSDYRFEPVGTQGHAYGIALWIPYHGTGGPDVMTAYGFRTHMGPCHAFSADYADDTVDFDLIRKLAGELEQIQPYYFGDYYPLTPYSLHNAVWMAWQYDRPDLGGGAVQAFRRAENGEREKTFRLRGLLPEASYRIRNCDAEGETVMTGAVLMQQGLRIELGEPAQAAVFFYERAAP